jgi:exodeoxyribonuclease VII small subunit
MTKQSKSIKAIDDMGYDEAYDELKSIVDILLSDQSSIDHLFDNISRANALVTHCQNKLRTVETLINQTME